MKIHIRSVILTLSICLTFSSCQDNSKNPSSKTFSDIRISDQIFEFGNKSKLTDPCTFAFDCDCCAEYLYFNKDGSFYHYLPCLEGDDLSGGTYSTQGNHLTLIYSSVCASSYLPIDDETQTEPSYESKQRKPYFRRLLITTCKNKIQLKNKKGEVGLEVLNQNVDWIPKQDSDPLFQYYRSKVTSRQ